jgi:AraC-like DNA-binding protein
MHWIFSEITDGSFRWRSVVTKDGGGTWQLREEMHVSRKPALGMAERAPPLSLAMGEDSRPLAKRPLAGGRDFVLETVECHCCMTGWSQPEPVARFGIVFLASGRPATAAASRRVVSAAREALASSPSAGVIELARRVAVSPHHLSRVFKAETGPCLARLTADLGFADQAHLARVVRQELGATLSSFRGRLAS